MNLSLFYLTFTFNRYIEITESKQMEIDSLINELTNVKTELEEYENKNVKYVERIEM